MKRAGIACLVGVMAFVGLVSVFGNAGKPAMPSRDPYEGFQTEQTTTDSAQGTIRPGAPVPGRITGPNEPPMIVGDANEIKARVKKYEGLESALQQVDKQSQNEEKQWTEMEVENRLELVRAVKAQMKEELMLLRKVALEEKAEKTAAAIDGLLLSRQDRFAKVIQKIEDEDARIAAREKRAQRNAGTAAGQPTNRRGSMQQSDQTMTGPGGTSTPQGTRTTTRRRR